MKKITILSVAVIALAFASCKKDRTCTCTITDTTPGSTTQTFEYTIVKEKKGIAKAACIKRTSEGSGGPSYTQTADCKLK